MGLLLPILFAVASLASFLLFKFLKNIKEWLKYVFFGLTIGFLIVSMTFAYLFVIDTFALDNVVRGCFAATFLYGFAISVLFFILTIKKENKIYGIVFTGKASITKRRSSKVPPPRSRCSSISNHG